MDAYQTFDPQLFLDAQVTEVSERRPPLPTDNPHSPDGLYVGVAGEPVTKTGTIGKGDRTGQPWVGITVPILIDVPQQLQDALKLPPQLTVNHMGFIDMTPDNRGYDMAPGRNGFMRAWREATGLNSAGQAFSWRMLTGRPVKVKIAWREAEVGGEKAFFEDVKHIFKP